MRKVIEKVRKFAEKHLADDSDSAHNIEHVMRVYHLAMKLAKRERVDLEVIKIAILLHDIGGAKERNDPSGKTDHAVESAKIAKPFLQKLGLSKSKIEHILSCIISHRYRSEQKAKTLEAKIVFDADKLETVGAVGIARGFVWVGKNDAHIYKKANITKYAKENLGGKINGRIHDKTKHSPQLNWETKDKFILDYLHTQKAKNIARERMNFSKRFFIKLEREIKGLE
ncbi:MAG: HD domain-containing protein [Patescibacteria group bacterium]|nr:HD domain-containing protein [Patescibacteria group bacterium]